MHHTGFHFSLFLVSSDMKIWEDISSIGILDIISGDS